MTVLRNIMFAFRVHFHVTKTKDTGALLPSTAKVFPCIYVERNAKQLLKTGLWTRKLPNVATMVESLVADSSPHIHLYKVPKNISPAYNKFCTTFEDPENLRRFAYRKSQNNQHETYRTIEVQRSSHPLAIAKNRADRRIRLQFLLMRYY